MRESVSLGLRKENPHCRRRRTVPARALSFSLSLTYTHAHTYTPFERTCISPAVSPGETTAAFQTCVAEATVAAAVVLKNSLNFALEKSHSTKLHSLIWRRSSQCLRAQSAYTVIFKYPNTHARTHTRTPARQRCHSGPWAGGRARPPRGTPLRTLDWPD